MIPTTTYPPRHPRIAIGGYRYFFNGQEGDNEVFRDVANFGFEVRQYDSRLGRWWSVDPKWSEYPGVSPYAFCGGNPIIFTHYGVVLLKNPDGNTISWIIEKRGKNAVEISPFLSSQKVDFEGNLFQPYNPIPVQPNQSSFIYRRN